MENIPAKAARAVLPVGTNIESRFDGGADWYPGVIEKYNSSNGTYDILFDDGDKTPQASRDLVRREPWFFLPPEDHDNIEEVEESLQALLEENEEHARDIGFQKHPVVSKYFDDESHYEGLWDMKKKVPEKKGLCTTEMGILTGGLEKWTSRWCRNV